MAWWYNSGKGVLAFCVLFVVWSCWYGMIRCPCPGGAERGRLCHRKEFYGVQLNHLVLFIVLGAVFPDFFYAFMVLGALFELWESWLDRNDRFVFDHLGGCLAMRPSVWRADRPHDTHVFAGEHKPLNMIDKALGIRNSQVHGWHGSVAEVVVNGVGFGIGVLANRLALYGPRANS